MFTVMCGGVGGACLRQQIAKHEGVDESFWLGCLLWWCVPCVPLIQESKNLGTMNEYVPNEMSAMERDARDAGADG